MTNWQRLFQSDNKKLTSSASSKEVAQLTKKNMEKHKKNLDYLKDK